MPRDVEYNVTASDKSGEGLRQSEENFKRSQDRIDKIHADHAKKRADQEAETAVKVGRGLERAFGQAAPKLQNYLGGLFTSIGTNAGPLLMAGIVGAAPLAGAAISAAVIGGAGAGGVLGGVLLASRDPRVKNAGGDLARNLMGQLEQDADVFVQPVLTSIGKIEARFTQLQPRIQRIFSNSAGFVDPLVEGTLDGVDGITRGLDSLIAHGGPVMRELGETIDEIGNATGDMMETIAGGSEGAARSLDQLTGEITTLIETTGYAVRGLSEVYEWMDKLGVNTALKGPIGWIQQIGEDTGLWGKEASETAPAVSDLATQAFQLQLRSQGASGEIVTLTQRINDLADGSRDAFTAQTNVGAAIDKATEAAKKNGATLSANTEKGRANREALSNLATAMIGQYNAAVKVNGEGERSNAVANRNRDAFVQLAAKMTGSKREAERLADALGLIKAPKPVRIDTNAPAVRKTVQALQAEINSLRGRTIPITVRVTKKGETLYGNQGSQFSAAAAGGSGFFAAPRDPGTVSRTGGPTPVSVTSMVEVALDGTPFYAFTARQIEDDRRRSMWREKVGRRNG